MSEYFLHYLWQYQFFNSLSLTTCSGESLQVLYPGIRNSNQGPDFNHSRILLDGIEWHGHVEIHLKSDDWMVHHHDRDKAYDAVILHVVWEHTIEITRTDASVIPVLELKKLVDPVFIDKYKSFQNSGIQLPCQYYLHELPNVYVEDMKGKVVVERIQRKATKVLEMVSDNNNHWEESFWQLMARNFGFKLNDEAFEVLGKAVPYKLVLQYASTPLVLEALLFGQAGFLDDAPEDSYVLALKKEYAFLAHKHSLLNKKMNAHQWKFMRTRPVNFPTHRIAQLAALMSANNRLIGLLDSINHSNFTAFTLDGLLSEYWQNHYRFGEKSPTPHPVRLESSKPHIVINVLIPFQYARFLNGWGNYSLENALEDLLALPVEWNKVTKEWKALGLRLVSSFDSQATIELYKEYCLKRKCLYCSIGTHILTTLHGNSTSIHSNPISCRADEIPQENPPS